MNSYVMAPADRVRPFAIVAVVELVGAALLVLGLDRDLIALVVIGALLFAIGTALVIAVILLRRRVRTEVRTDAEGIEIRSGGRTATAHWSEITGVSADQRTIYLDRTDDRPALKIDSPRGGEDPTLKALADELARRLDDSRGYRPL
jgi:hypothetical protein